VKKLIEKLKFYDRVGSAVKKNVGSVDNVGSDMLYFGCKQNSS
jgi:hypothetical protein